MSPTIVPDKSALPSLWRPGAIKMREAVRRPAVGNANTMTSKIAVTRRTLGVSVAALAVASAARAAPGDKPLYKDPAQSIELRVRDLLSRMTIEEKAAQLIGIWLTKAAIQTPEGDFSPEAASKNFPHGLGQVSRPTDRRGLKPATVVDAAAGAEDGSKGRNAPETARYVNAAQKWAMEKTRLGIPMLMHDEALHGYVARDATSFPQAIALASTFDTDLVEKVFSMAAREMRARGSNIALAPVVDVARDPRWGRIEETYGEDPHLCAEIGLAAIRGFQAARHDLAGCDAGQHARSRRAGEVHDHAGLVRCGRGSRADGLDPGAGFRGGVFRGRAAGGTEQGPGSDQDGKGLLHDVLRGSYWSDDIGKDFESTAAVRMLRPASVGTPTQTGADTNRTIRGRAGPRAAQAMSTPPSSISAMASSRSSATPTVRSRRTVTE